MLNFIKKLFGLTHNDSLNSENKQAPVAPYKIEPALEPISVATTEVLKKEEIKPVKAKKPTKPKVEKVDKQPTTVAKTKKPRTKKGA